jgi:hypothetical protein
MILPSQNIWPLHLNNLLFIHPVWVARFDDVIFQQVVMKVVLDTIIRENLEAANLL